MLITVITVVYNGERYLEETIKSVLSQDYKDLEYIIIDGGSTDRTLDIIRSYESGIRKWVSEKDNGLSDAMNKGFRLSSGDWILYLHADDAFSNSQALRHLVDAAKDSKSKWVTGYLRFQDSKGNIFRKDQWHSISWNGMLLRNVIRHQATIVMRSAMVEFKNEFKLAMDYDFFLRLWKKAGPPTVVKRHIVDFRLDGNNLSSNYFASLRDEMRVRVKFRADNNESFKIAADYIVYIIRYLKIMLIHKRSNVR